MSLHLETLCSSQQAPATPYIDIQYVYLYMCVYVGIYVYTHIYMCVYVGMNIYMGPDPNVGKRCFKFAFTLKAFSRHFYSKRQTAINTHIHTQTAN